MHYSSVFQMLKGRLQDVELVESSNVCQQNESSAVRFSLLCSVYCFTQLLYHSTE